ncbi:MAG: GreA/GreB family elongation factor [Verrucomicrobia bacterium]|nr:GreA/GreB family elongation factor [Verrucomicrobiota bacterium]
MNKRALLKKIISQIEEELESYTRAARAAHAEATDPQNKAENKYDTRGLEAAYLAGAQSRQAAETQNAIESFQKLALKEFKAGELIDLSAFVEVETRGERMFFFVGPSKGGLEVDHNNKEVTVITPQAPLGQQLVGRKSGDRFKWGAGPGASEYKIVAVE